MIIPHVLFLSDQPILANLLMIHELNLLFDIDSQFRPTISNLCYLDHLFLNLYKESKHLSLQIIHHYGVLKGLKLLLLLGDDHSNSLHILQLLHMSSFYLSTPTNKYFYPSVHAENRPRPPERRWSFAKPKSINLIVPWRCSGPWRWRDHKGENSKSNE